MKKKLKTSFRNIFYSFKLVIKSNPLYFFVICTINILLAFILAYNTVKLDEFLNSVEIYIQDNNNFMYVIKTFVGLILAILLNPVINSINTCLSADFEEKVKGEIKRDFNEKCSKLDCLQFESSSDLINLEKNYKGINSLVLLVTGFTLGIFTYLPYFIILAVYFYKINHSLIFILFLFFIGPILSLAFKKRIYKKLEDDVSPLRVQSKYYKDYMISTEYIKETRLLGAFSFFMKKYKNTIKSMDENIEDAQKKSAIIEFTFKIPLIVANMVSFFIVIKYLKKGLVTIGNFGAIIASINMLIMMAEELIFYVIGSAVKEISLVENFIDFMKSDDDAKKDIAFTRPPAIEFDKVSFKYPDSNKMALKKVSFKINKGEKVAVVGANGSGKSTIAKLVAGLYTQTSGKILYDSYDPLYDKVNVTKNISAVFQDFCRYKMTLLENIVISDVRKENNNDLSQFINSSNLNLSKKIFPLGFDTVLSREFDGVDLSGGQWQKIAISRGDYKDSNIIILDEPTSAIDPIEEEVIFNNFLNMAENKTAIIITHKMSITRFVDKIIVMEDGYLKEFGSHDELIRVNGLYKKMYTQESKSYVNI